MTSKYTMIFKNGNLKTSQTIVKSNYILIIAVNITSAHENTCGAKKKRTDIKFNEQ